MGCRHPNAGHDCQIPKLTKNPKTTTEVLAFEVVGCTCSN